MHILHVVGARPNFMKAAPVWQALAKREVRQTLVHTGQHYDDAMSDVFFRQLGLPRADENLGVGSASHAQQTAAIMATLEPILLRRRPDFLIVYGDVNSTIAAALVAVKLGIRIAHVEAGLRSFDRSMPEEINRILTDQLSDLLFTPSADGNENLAREGVSPAKVHLVGNVMIDTLVRLLPATENTTLSDGPPCYFLVTLHRPANVDDPQWLGEAMRMLEDVSQKIPIVFPVHPRTRQKINDLKLDLTSKGVRLLEPVAYLEFLGLQRRATAVITDSGGVQEETTYLGIPCLTLRENTERPITISLGTNILLGRDLNRLRIEVDKILSGTARPSSRKIPPLWDGAAGGRIADVILKG